jgi:hypothetical protein
MPSARSSCVISATSTVLLLPHSALLSRTSASKPQLNSSCLYSSLAVSPRGSVRQSSCSTAVTVAAAVVVVALLLVVLTALLQFATALAAARSSSGAAAVIASFARSAPAVLRKMQQNNAYLEKELFRQQLLYNDKHYRSYSAMTQHLNSSSTDTATSTTNTHQRQALATAAELAAGAAQ